MRATVTSESIDRSRTRLLVASGFDEKEWTAERCVQLASLNGVVGIGIPEPDTQF